MIAAHVDRRNACFSQGQRIWGPYTPFGGSAAHLWPCLTAGESAFLRERLRTADGSTLWLQSAYSPVLDTGGLISRIVQIATDATVDTVRDLAELSPPPFSHPRRHPPLLPQDQLTLPR